MRERLFWISFFSLILNLGYGFDDSSDCFRKLEKNFFESDATLKAFSLYHLPQSSWTLIYGQLVNASVNIPNQVRLRAANLRPDPMKAPFNAKKAWEILEQVLFEVFQQVLRNNNAFNQFNDNSIKGMFDFIVVQHQKEIEECLIQLEKESAKKY